MIASTVNRNAYVGTGTAGPFAYNFRIFAYSDLRIIKTSVTGVDTVLTYITHYTATGVGNASGTVTLVTALAVGETLTIRRVRPITQERSIRNNGVYFASVHEDEWDDLVMQMQQLSDEIRRSVRAPESIDPAFMSLLVKGETGKVLGWDSTTLLTNKTLDSSAIALPGNGRTVATVSAHLANNAIFNILDYAPRVGDVPIVIDTNVNDALSAIQAAVDACAATGGGRVWSPPGRTYKTTGQLTLKDNVELYGPGATINCTMAAGTAIYANGAQSGTYFPSLTANATVRGYQVQVGSSAGFAAGSVIEIQEVTTGDIEVNVVDSVPDGTHLNLVYPLSRGFTTANAGRVILVAPVVKPSVRGIRLLTTGTTVGVAFLAVDRGLVRGCEFTTAGTAVNVMTSLHVDIIDNKALDCGYTPGGPVIGYRASNGGRCADNVITRYAGDEAIVLFKNNQFIDIIDNRIFRARLSGGCGIQVDTDNKHILIKGNKVVKAGNAGIYLTGNNEHIEVLGNHCIDCAADGIGIDNGFHIAVSGNHLVTNSAWGLRIAATCSNVIHGDNYYRSNASGSVTDLNSTGAVNPRGGYLDLTSGELRVSGTKVLGARDTGWTAGTGTPNKGAFAADAATAVQAAQRVLALEAMLRTQGVIN